MQWAGFTTGYAWVFVPVKMKSDRNVQRTFCMMYRDLEEALVLLKVA